MLQSPRKTSRPPSPESDAASMGAATKGRSKRAASKKTTTRKQPAKRVGGKKKKKKTAAKAAKPAEGRKLKAKSPGKTPSAPDVEIGPEVLEFIDAIDDFKARYGRPFPTWSEILWIVRSLGYQKA